jgi:cAMP-dependent protein kinase regulator
MTSTRKQDVQEELKRYLDDKQLNTLFVAIVEKLLLDKPDEPISYIVQYLKVNGKETKDTNLSHLDTHEFKYFSQDKFPSETQLLFSVPHEMRGV